MADFSSRGPCEDGRIKPDVVAPGHLDCLAAIGVGHRRRMPGRRIRRLLISGRHQPGRPARSGAAAVFVQYYRETHTNATPSPALVKAALINSAVDMDDATGTEPVPNMDEGWGRVDLTQIMWLDRVRFPGSNSPCCDRPGVRAAGARGPPDEPLKITLTYTDVPGFPGSLPALVNDLDLEVVAPDGRFIAATNFLWASRCRTRPRATG